MSATRHADIPSPSDTSHEVERWLREDVAAGHLEYLADPASAVPSDKILDRIKARRGVDHLR